MLLKCRKYHGGNLKIKQIIKFSKVLTICIYATKSHRYNQTEGTIFWCVLSMLQNKDYGAPNLIAGILLTRLHHCSHACPRVCARQVLKKNNEPVFTHNSEGVRPQTTIMPLPVLDTSRERGETAPLNHVLLIQVSATNSNLPFTYGISFILLFIMSFPLPSILSTI